MAYLGREVWAFLTEDGIPGKLYSVSGRSQASRERKAVYYPEERRVAIEPLDKTQAGDVLRHYNAMRYNDGLLVVSNGLHTDDIFNSRDKKPVALRRILNTWGSEPDSLHTPRIAGMINDQRLYLAMISDSGVSSIRVRPTLGTAYGISTYSGQGTGPKSFDTGKLLKQRMLPSLKVEGKSPEDIVDFFADDLLDPEFFVCCVSALWYGDSREWQLAVRNLYS